MRLFTHKKLYEAEKWSSSNITDLQGTFPAVQKGTRYILNTFNGSQQPSFPGAHTLSTLICQFQGQEFTQKVNSHKTTEHCQLFLQWKSLRASVWCSRWSCYPSFNVWTHFQGCNSKHCKGTNGARQQVMNKKPWLWRNPSVVTIPSIQVIPLSSQQGTSVSKSLQIFNCSPFSFIDNIFLIAVLIPFIQFYPVASYIKPYFFLFSAFKIFWFIGINTKS